MAAPRASVRRWGITLPLLDLPLSEHREWLREIVDLGYTDLWSMETDGLDAFTPLAVAAAWAPELRLGTAIASVFARGPALLTQTAAGIAEAAPGRFVLGLGASSEVMVSGWNGIAYEAPYKRCRDTLRFVRRALAGERIDEAIGSIESRGFTLSRKLASQPPIYLAALNRDMLRLAGREADGVMLGLVGPADVAPLVATVAEGGERGAADVVLRIGVLPIADTERARAFGRRVVAAYLSVPAYAKMHQALGHAERLQPMWDAWRSGDRRAALAAVPDEVVDELFVYGPPEACRDKLVRFVEAGVTTPLVSIMPFGGDRDELRAVVRALAPPA